MIRATSIAISSRTTSWLVIIWETRGRWTSFISSTSVFHKSTSMKTEITFPTRRTLASKAIWFFQAKMPLPRLHSAEETTLFRWYTFWFSVSIQNSLGLTQKGQYQSNTMRLPTTRLIQSHKILWRPKRSVSCHSFDMPISLSLRRGLTIKKSGLCFKKYY